MNSIKCGVYLALTNEISTPTIVEIKKNKFRVIGYFTFDFNVVMCRYACKWESIKNIKKKVTLKGFHQ